MVSKLLVAIAFFGLASGGFLKASPNHLINKLVSKKLIPGQAAWTDVMQHMMALDVDMEVDAGELEDMETTIKSLMSKGDDPQNKMAVKQLSGFIVNVLIPNREKQQKADEDSLTMGIKAIESCRLRERVKRTPVVADKLKTVEGHKDDYTDSIAEAGSCHDVLEGKSMVKDAYCASVEDPAKVCGCEERMVKLFGQRNGNCADAPEITSENRKCCDAYFQHEKHNADCMNAKSDAKYAEKQHSIIMGNLCDTYDQCYDDESSAYRATEQMVKKREATRSWASLFKIKCLVDGFKDHGDKDVKEYKEDKTCEQQKAEKHEIEYPTVPEKRDCNEEVDA